MEPINAKVMYSLLSVAVLAGISLAAKETIGNIWAGICFMLNLGMRRGCIIEAKIQGEVLTGTLIGFGFNRVVIQDQEGNKQLILVGDLKKSTIKILGDHKKK